MATAIWTDIGKVLNEYDMDAIDTKLTWGTDTAADVETINKYMKSGERKGAWWGDLRALNVRPTGGSMDVEWTRDPAE